MTDCTPYDCPLRQPCPLRANKKKTAKKTELPDNFTVVETAQYLMLKAENARLRQKVDDLNCAIHRHDYEQDSWQKAACRAMAENASLKSDNAAMKQKVQNLWSAISGIESIAGEKQRCPLKP